MLKVRKELENALRNYARVMKEFGVVEKLCEKDGCGAKEYVLGDKSVPFDANVSFYTCRYCFAYKCSRHFTVVRCNGCDILTSVCERCYFRSYTLCLNCTELKHAKWLCKRSVLELLCVAKFGHHALRDVIPIIARHLWETRSDRSVWVETEEAAEKRRKKG